MVSPKKRRENITAWQSAITDGAQSFFGLIIGSLKYSMNIIASLKLIKSINS